jgi:hypothetical protein
MVEVICISSFPSRIGHEYHPYGKMLFFFSAVFWPVILGQLVDAMVTKLN